MDFIGYINFGLNPFVEVSVDYKSDSGCNNVGGKMRCGAFKSGLVPGSVLMCGWLAGIRAVLNWGLAVTVGFSINITGIEDIEWGPYALANIKKPIVAGCAQLTGTCCSPPTRADG